MARQYSSATRAWLCALGAAVSTIGCMDDPYVTLPADTNAQWKRSVIIDASKCVKKDGSIAACADTKAADMQRVAHMSGVIGAPLAAIAADGTNAAIASFPALTAQWARVPVGYGCDATLQEVFPDAKKDPSNINNYNLTRLSEIIAAVVERRASLIWTAAYHLGDGTGTCTFGEHGMEQGGKAVGEQSGKALGPTDADLQKWAKVVRRVIEYYDLDLPASKKGDSACNPPSGTEKPWFCDAKLFNIEYGRDPNGAGGFTVDSKAVWLKGYKAFSSEIRLGFPYPANSVALFAPSVVISGKSSVEVTTGSQRSWIFDFIDYVVNEKLPLSFLTFEVVAATPVEAADIVRAVRKYADTKGLKSEDGAAIPIFLTDLRIQESKLPTSLTTNPGRLSAYRGAFYAATKALCQGMVFGATFGRVVRFPTKDPATVTAEESANTALDADLLWFKEEPPAPGTLKPAAWQSLWFYDGYLGGGGDALDQRCTKKEGCPAVAAEARRKSMLQVQHGPDAAGFSGTAKSDPVQGLIAVATRETCVSVDPDSLGKVKDCLDTPDDKKFPALTAGRQNVIRVMVADLNWLVGTKETLKHDFRIQVEGMPADVKTVGYRWARLDGNGLEWKQHNFPDQGVLDVKNGAFHLRRDVAVPSMQYFEFLY